MNQALLLFAFRLVSAGLLLALLGGMAWLVYQDLRLSAATAAEQHQSQGHLRVIESEAGRTGLRYALSAFTSDWYWSSTRQYDCD